MNELLTAIGALTSAETLNFIFLGVLVYVGVLWIALILWVTKDITNRTNSMAFQIISIALIIFLTPIFGLPIYILMRPSRTLMERYFEEVEQDMIEQYYDSAEGLDSPEESLDTTPKKKKIIKKMVKTKVTEEAATEDLD